MQYLLHIRPAKPQGCVIADEDGSRIRLDSMTVYFTRLTRKAGLKGSIHILRHTAISMWLNAGVPPAVAQRWAGHASLNTTMGYYSPDAEDSVHMERVGAYLQRVCPSLLQISPAQQAIAVA